MSPSAHKVLRHMTLIALAIASGCLHSEPRLHYLGDADNAYYRGHATQVSYPAIVTETPPDLAGSLSPHTIRDMEQCTVRDMSLGEAVQLALMNSEVIRADGQFLTPGNSLLTNPNNVSSVYDPAIQESGVLFGGRGVEAALADFDAQFTTSMVWGRDETAVLGSRETGTFRSSLDKFFASGGRVGVSHDIDYLWSNAGAGLFDSAYSGSMEFTFQQPLLAGAGTEYTRTAGPVARSFGGITGVSQGVLISRINNDLAIARFDGAVQNLLRDVEYSYWNLYLAYRNFATAVVARNSALDTWRLTKKQAGEVLIPADEAQARTTLYAAESAVRTAQSNIFTSETRLRRLIGLPVNDGEVIRTADEPVTAELVPDWYSTLTEALMNRWELRQQKWNIKSLDLQLTAARSLTRPRLDFLAGYRINGYGDDLLGYNGSSLNSYGQALTANNHTGWNVGFQFNLPVGLRSAHAQVRNYELRLAKAQKVLAEQEIEVGHELAAALQELTRSYEAMQMNYLRYVATEENVKGLEPRVLTEDNVDVILRAYERRAAAELDYYRSLVEYNQALVDLQWRKGAILDYNNVNLMEGGWAPEAYDDAQHHADGRAYSRQAKHLESHPADFASGAPVGRVTFTTEQAAEYGSGAAEPQPTPAAPPIPAAEPAPDAPAPEAAAMLTPAPVVRPAGWEFDLQPSLETSSAVQAAAGAGIANPQMRRPNAPALEAPNSTAIRRLPRNSGLWDIDDLQLSPLSP